MIPTEVLLARAILDGVVMVNSVQVRSIQQIAHSPVEKLLATILYNIRWLS